MPERRINVREPYKITGANHNDERQGEFEALLALCVVARFRRSV
jgi:hypothetical protein